MRDTSVGQTVSPTKRPFHQTFSNPSILTAAAVIGISGWVTATRLGVALPGCPFRTLTGLDCPGCGSTRCLSALTEGDLTRAFDHNLLVPMALVLLVWHGVVTIGNRLGWWSHTAPLTHRWAARAVLVTVLAFWAIRLVPWGPGTYLGSGA